MQALVKFSVLPATSTEFPSLKLPSPMKNVDAQLFRVALGRIDRRDARAQLPHSLHHFGKIDFESTDVHAELRAVPSIVSNSRRTDQRLRGNAADIQAIAAKQVPFDQRNLSSEPGRASSCDQARRPAADDDEVVFFGRLRIDPIRRVDVGDEEFVVLVLRWQGEFGGVAHESGQAAVSASGLASSSSGTCSASARRAIFVM